MCRAAYKYGAATAAHKSTDTVKIADSKGFIDNTVDRNTVWLAQTPQVFKTKLYRAAAYYAKESGFTGTDDCSLVENIKRRVKLVDVGRDNIKITCPEDIDNAVMIIRKREGKTS